MISEYRPGRVKVSGDIKEAILNLMSAEGDTGSKKKHAAKWYRSQVAKKLKLTLLTNPSMRAYEVTIKGLREKLKEPNPLDKEWHFGLLSNKEYVISPIGVAKIVEYKTRAVAPESVTIRIALWMDRFSALPLTVDNLFYMARKYANQDILKTLLGDNYYAGANSFSDDLMLKVLITPLDFCVNRCNIVL